MRSNDGTRTGGEILIDQLVIQGVRHAFCVPGESYLAALDALHDAPIELTICRHESAAAMMAEAVGKATGRPGICFVTRGPGATNGSAGVHIAKQDSAPMIMFVGQVGRDMREREAFQELDYRQVFGGIAKWATEIDDPARIPEIVSRAFFTACNGRPGPVVIALPEDMLTERCLVPNASAVEPVETWPGLNDMSRLQKMLWAAKKPIALIGGSRWSEAASAAMMRFAERFALPVATTFRYQHLFDSSHPCYAGDFGIGPNPKLLARIKGADLVLLIGDRMSEMSSQSYTLFNIPEPQMKLVHVHPGSEELGRVYHAALAINASPTAFCAALEGLQPPTSIAWGEATRTARADYLAWSETVPAHPGSFQMAAVVAALRALPEDAILTNGAGNYAIWLHRFHRFRRYGTQVAPTSGSMGYGLPAAIAAKLAHPDRVVVALAGDGCFQMTSQEMATALQANAAVVVVVIDNGIYGTIRMHQERTYPGRVSGTTMKNPDFAALARAHGAHGATVETSEDFAPALAAAIASRRPALLHVKLDPQAITPTKSIDDLRAGG